MYLVDSFPTFSSASSVHSEQRFEILKSTVSIYLHGEAETVNVSVQPSALDLINMKMGVEERRVLQIRNHSMYLPIVLRYKKVPFITINPVLQALSKNEIRDVLIKINPRRLGNITTKIVFDLLFKHLHDEKYQELGTIEIPVTLDVTSYTNHFQPRFNVGITPMLTNEVGFLTDDVTFESDIKKPQCAMIQSKASDKKALIAFPNDRPKSLKPWKNKTV